MSTPVKILARGWILEVYDGGYIPVNGLSTFTFDGTKNDADTTSFEDSGWQTHLVASRSRSIGFEAFYLEDPDDGGRDPGQEAIEALADQIGQDSLTAFRLTSPAGTIREFNASANVSGVGGGKDDPTGFSGTLNVSGAAAMATVLDTVITVLPATITLAVADVSDAVTTTFTPATTTDKTLTYEITTGPTIAAVTPEGRIIGLASGAAVLTVTSAEGHTDTVAITVS